MTTDKTGGLDEVRELMATLASRPVGGKTSEYIAARQLQDLARAALTILDRHIAAQGEGSRKMLDDWRLYKQSITGFDTLENAEKYRIQDIFSTGWLDGFSVGHAEGMATTQPNIYKGFEDKVLEHRYRYYVLSKPVITDAEYDKLEAEARAVLPPSSPVHGVGSEFEDSYPQYIIDKVKGR